MIQEPTSKTMCGIIKCGLLLSLAVATMAYDFSDSDYNQVLARDLEDLQDDSSFVGHPRSRRDEEAVTLDKCKRRRPKFCCADDVLEKIHDEDKPIKKECYKQVTGKEKSHGGFHSHDPFKCDKDKVEKHRKEMTCVMQCVGQKKEVIDKDGNIIEDEMRNHLKERFSKEDWFVGKIDDVVKKCLAEAKNEPKSEDEDACNGQNVKFGFCFWRELQTSCPSDQIKDMKVCEKVRDRIKNHPDMPFSRSVMEDE